MIKITPDPRLMVHYDKHYCANAPAWAIRRWILLRGSKKPPSLQFIAGSVNRQFRMPSWCPSLAE